MFVTAGCAKLTLTTSQEFESQQQSTALHFAEVISVTADNIHTQLVSLSAKPHSSAINSINIY